MKKVFIYILFALFWTACCGEASYDYSWAIDNTTSDTLTFILNGENTFNLEDDTIIIDPHRGWILHSISENNTLPDVNCVSIFDQLEIETIISGNKMLNIDINDEAFWHSEVYDTECSYYKSCSLTIEPEHLTKIEME